MNILISLILSTIILYYKYKEINLDQEKNERWLLSKEIQI